MCRITFLGSHQYFFSIRAHTNFSDIGFPLPKTIFRQRRNAELRKQEKSSLFAANISANTAQTSSLIYAYGIPHFAHSTQTNWHLASHSHSHKHTGGASLTIIDTSRGFEFIDTHRLFTVHRSTNPLPCSFNATECLNSHHRNRQEFHVAGIGTEANQLSTVTTKTTTRINLNK